MRVVDEGYFIGVRTDTAMLFDRGSIDPESRINPALAIVDMPFSFAGDILFLPYDAYADCTYARNRSATNFQDKAEMNVVETNR